MAILLPDDFGELLAEEPDEGVDVDPLLDRIPPCGASLGTVVVA